MSQNLSSAAVVISALRAKISEKPIVFKIHAYLKCIIKLVYAKKIKADVYQKVNTHSSVNMMTTALIQYCMNVVSLLNSFPASGDCCRLLITFANSLYTDQAVKSIQQCFMHQKFAMAHHI